MEELRDTVEDRCAEIEELKRQEVEIKKRIKELSAPRSFLQYVSERPLSHPRNLKYDEPVFGYERKHHNQSVWDAFVILAKTVHEKSPKFYMDSALGGRPYIRETNSEKIRKINQLSTEQVRISGEMLSEMIAIYNKYFVMLHEKVVYDPRNGLGERLVDVIPPQNDKKESEVK